MTNEECRTLNLQMLSMRQTSKVGEMIWLVMVEALIWGTVW